ncbi:MAG: helix-turn-helix domain-containing protein [Verrucomicrobia bacterium]|nr:helix-turn-helix domain-containing protein [Verrucomicrobiota bacterium]
MLLRKQFESVEQMNPLFEQVDGSLLQTGPGGKEWEITMAPLPSGGISHIKCCAPVTGLGATRDGDVCFLVPWQQKAPHVFMGIDMSQDGFSAYGPRTSHVGRVKSESEITMMLFSERRALSSFETLAGPPGAASLRGFNAINPPPGSRRRLDDYLGSMLSSARKDGAMLQHPSVIGEIEGRILQILCETMTGFGSHTQRPPLRCRNRAAVVKRSWDIIRASGDTPVTLEALCRGNNVSLRTLEYAFHEIAGMSPNVFLRIHRLHIAQRKMVCGGARFVKEAAYAGGFFHLGRFSADYKMVFGETPLQTLQRIHGRRAGRRALEPA